MKCYQLHDEHKVQCNNKACRQWINCKQHQNCTIVAAKRGTLLLQEIGDILSISRMRVCQIEKRIIEKLSSLVN